MPLSVKGKVYDLPGMGEVPLYPISRIARELTKAGLPRTTQTIRKWELWGVLPPALFYADATGKRLYTMDQIECIVRVALACDIKRGLERDEFKEKIWQELTKLNEKYTVSEY
jgi:hypothetical protein